MENKVDVPRELALAELKKETLGRACELAHAQASSVLLFTMQWKDLEEHLDKTMKCVEEKGVEVHSKMKLLEERERVVGLKESDLVSVQNRIEECNGELEGKVSELEAVRRSVEECRVELEGKQKELGLLMMRVDECRSQLSEIDKLTEVRKEEFAMQVDSFERLIVEYKEELAVKEHDFSEIEKSIEVCNREIEAKRKELKLTEDHLVELHSQEKKLESLEEDARRRIEGKEVELEAMTRKVKEYSGDIELIEREFNAMSERTNERAQELSIKKKQLNSVQQSIEKRTKELKVKEELIMLIEKSLVKCSKELELKKKHLSSVKNSVEELNDEHLSEELELDFIKSMTSQYLEELKEKEEHFNSFKNSLTERCQDLEVKEAQFEERVKAFELKEKQSQKMIEEQHKKLEMQEKQLTSIYHPQVKIEQPESSRANEGMGLLCPNLKSCIMGNGRTLQLLMNEHLKKNDLFLGEISNAIKKACDPAKLVLDAMQGFFPVHLQDKDGGFDVIRIRRTCILLLEHLLSFSPQITPQVRDDAMKLAGEWKAKMVVAVDHSLEVLGFLLLVAAFGLASDFDGNELQELLDIVDPHKQKPELIHALRIANELPVKHILPFRVKTEQLEHTLDSNTIDAPSENCLRLSTAKEGSNIDEHDLLPSEVSAALLVSPDPAKFVLDFIQGSYLENLKKGSTNNEGVMRIYILLLEQLKDVLPIINPQVKAQAKKLAVEWKSKMRVVSENSLAVMVFLLFLATYELVTYINREEILKLIFTVAQHKQAPELCRALGFTNMVPDFVHNLIGRNQHLEAVRFICAFKLMDNISPEAVCKQYLYYVRTTASNMFKEGNNFLDTEGKAIDFEVTALRALIDCLEECKLECLIGSDNIRDCIVRLEKQKPMSSHCLPSFNLMKPQQLQGKFGSSATTNQPPFHSMLQPQHGEKNHCAGASTSWSVVQNCNVMLEKDTTQWDHHIPAPNVMTQQQLQGKNCNFSTSTRDNQPTSGPMFYQQLGKRNHSLSAFGPENQLHQQDSQKCPRTDSYTSQIPAPVNPFVGLQGGWHGPGVPANRKQGLHKARARYTTSSGGQDQVAGNPSRSTANRDVRCPYHFQHKHN